MGTTPIYNLPYIEPTDALANYPAQDKAQALAVEAAINVPTLYGDFRRTSNQNIPNNVATVVQLTALTNEGGFTVSGGVITVPSSGLYQINGFATWITPGNATGARFAYLMLNGQTQLRVSATPSTSAYPLCHVIARAMRITGGHTIGLSVFQNCGTSLEVDSSNAATQLTVTRLSY